jgi:hypothetical protein
MGSCEYSSKNIFRWDVLNELLFLLIEHVRHKHRDQMDSCDLSCGQCGREMELSKYLWEDVCQYDVGGCVDMTINKYFKHGYD